VHTLVFLLFYRLHGLCRRDPTGNIVYAVLHGISPTWGGSCAAPMHVVKYMKYTEQFKLVFGARRNAKPVGLFDHPSAPSFPPLAYGDADYANCVETRRSVTGLVITVDGIPVVWASRKQPTITKSTTAAESVAASMTADEAILVQKILSDLGKPQKRFRYFVTIQLQSVY
jgi:hypothetical protein